jgi:hypothetical protein
VIAVASAEKGIEWERMMGRVSFWHGCGARVKGRRSSC